MRQVSIPVHPLTRRVLLCEYGAEPFTFNNHDFLFKLLTAAPIRDRAIRNAEKLSARITLFVDDALARHIESRTRSIGMTLMSYHMQTLCRYADGALHMRGRGHVKESIEQWLLLHRVDENEYAAETAYKLWQRHGWKIQEKNSVFFGQWRGKSAPKMSKKTAAHANFESAPQTLRLRLSEVGVELAASKFVQALETCYRRPPHRIRDHARIYFYAKHGGLSCREIAARLGVKKSTANYAIRTIERRAGQNNTIYKLLQEALPIALPGAD